MKKNKFLYAGLTAALVAGSMGTVAPTQSVAADSSNSYDAEVGGIGSMPIDKKHFTRVNDERMIESLVKQGLISANATPEQKNAALNQYLQTRVKANELRSNKEGSRSSVVKNFASSNTVQPAPAQTQAWNGTVRKDKVLVLLVDFPDFKRNSLTASDTDFFYKDFSPAHYKQMLFGTNGYVDPNGEQQQTLAQWYLEQSGGSFTVDGDVMGWYTASKPAAAYGGNVNDDDRDPRGLVREALDAAVANGVNLANYDQLDKYDADGDGNTFEPDGVVDNLMIVHAGVGEEAGGGPLGADAVWSHRWDLKNVYTPAGATASAFDYCIQPEDGAVGVFAHEFGHILGLADEYDTEYSGNGEPVEYWSVMSSGSWAGKIGGVEPTGFSPYAKQYFQKRYGGNWQAGKTVKAADLNTAGVTLTLDQASTHGKNEDVVRIDLPSNTTPLIKPLTGSYQYFGGRGDEIKHTMTAAVDLTGGTSAVLDFDTWYNIEDTWDYGFVQVSADNGTTWQSLSSARTRSDLHPDGYPAIKSNLPGYTGASNGWVHETIDLSAYAGKQIQLRFAYMTDWSSNNDGFFVDNVKVSKNGAVVFEDGGESTAKFVSKGFDKNDGYLYTNHHYLVEWRTPTGSDKGLAHIARGNSLLAYDAGLLVWYVNEAYDNNWVGYHPGYGYLGVVDAHQNVHHWGGYDSNGETAGARYQMYDAAFSLTKGGDLDISYGKNLHLYNAAKNPVPVFSDKTNYFSPSTPSSGLKLPTYGLKIEVLAEAADRSTATIKISK